MERVRRCGGSGGAATFSTWDPPSLTATIRHQISLYHLILEENGHEKPEDMVIVREFFCAPTHEEAAGTGPSQLRQDSTKSTPTSVLLLPLLNPVEVAEQVASLDHIAERRFILGIGLGYRPEECEAFGTRMSQRGTRCTEALGLMRRLWTDDEVTHHGQYYNVTGSRPTARPYQKPHPKIWQAAMSDPAVRRVGRGGDVLYVGPAQSNATIRHQISLYHQTLEENGHEMSRGHGHRARVLLRPDP